MKIEVFASKIGTHYHFHCPGCGYGHSFVVRNDGGRPGWQFDGNLESPTFSPSLRVLGEGDTTLCHLFLIGGKIQYLNDSAHRLAGQTVDLVELDP